MEKNIEFQDKHKTIDIGKAVVVAERVALHNVRVIKSSCLLKPSGTKGPYEVTLSQQEIDIQINKEKKTLVVLPSFSLNAFVINNKKDSPDFEISATFALTYTLEDLDDLSAENFQAFGHANGIYNAWPYWREFIQSMTARMGVPSLTIPVFRLSPPNNKKAEKLPAKKRVNKSAKKKK